MASNISVPTYTIQHSGGKSSWQDGEIITASSLNKMQRQIKKNTDGFSNVVQYSTAQPTNQYNQVWINSNSQQNNRTIRLAQMDDVNTILENVNNFENNVIKISTSQPDEAENKLWIRKDGETQIQIPTYDQFSIFKTTIYQLLKISQAITLNYEFIEGNYSLLIKTGTIKQDNDYKVTDYIDISNYTKLLYSKCKSLTGNSIGIYFYDENQNPIPPGIAGSYDTSSGYINSECIIPQGAKYVRLTALSSNLSEFYVKGTSNIEPVFSGIQETKNIVNKLITNFAGEYNQYTSYAPGQLVFNEGKLYISLQFVDEEHTIDEQQYWAPITINDYLEGSYYSKIYDMINDNIQSALQYDLIPTEDSQNLLTSGRLYNVFQNIDSRLSLINSSLNDKQDELTFDDEPKNNSLNPVTSNGIYITKNNINNQIEYLNKLSEIYNNILEIESPTQTSIDSINRAINYLDGSLVTNSTYTATGNFDIRNFDYIYFKRIKKISNDNIPQIFGMAFYNRSSVYIEGIPAALNQQSLGYTEMYLAKVPANAVYARFTTYSDINTYGQFELKGIPKTFLNPIAEKSSTILSNFALQYNRQATYAPGQYVIYNNSLWKCENLTGNGIWNQSDWVRASVAGSLEYQNNFHSNMNLDLLNRIGSVSNSLQEFSVIENNKINDIINLGKIKYWDDNNDETLNTSNLQIVRNNNYITINGSDTENYKFSCYSFSDPIFLTSGNNIREIGTLSSQDYPRTTQLYKDHEYAFIIESVSGSFYRNSTDSIYDTAICITAVIYIQEQDTPYRNVSIEIRDDIGSGLTFTCANNTKALVIFNITHNQDVVFDNYCFRVQLLDVTNNQLIKEIYRLKRIETINKKNIQWLYSSLNENNGQPKYSYNRDFL